MFSKIRHKVHQESYYKRSRITKNERNDIFFHFNPFWLGVSKLNTFATVSHPWAVFFLCSLKNYRKDLLVSFISTTVKINSFLKCIMCFFFCIPDLFGFLNRFDFVNNRF